MTLGIEEPLFDLLAEVEEKLGEVPSSLITAACAAIRSSGGFEARRLATTYTMKLANAPYMIGAFENVLRVAVSATTTTPLTTIEAGVPLPEK
jgi:hypothetical protein